MKPVFHDVLEKSRVNESDSRMQTFRGERMGRFIVRAPGDAHLVLVISDGSEWEESGLEGQAWEHVSVSVHRDKRTPTWEEMCFVKDLCWEAEECVVQYHPPRSDYVNFHPGVLHLWKPIGVEIPRPPSICVGPK